MSQPHWVCPHSWCVCFSCQHCLGSRLLCQELRPALGCMHYPGLSRSGSGTRVILRAQTWLGLRFVPFPGLSSSGDQVLDEHSGSDLWPPPFLPLGFLGVQLTHLLRCAVCLFWGADVWLRPSQQMSTVQNPKKSWLTMKPASSLVDDASLGP